MSDPKEPTVRLSSCRQDGRCPVCEAAGWTTNSPTKGRVSVWRGIPCGCTICSSYACVTEHTRDLLTEALRQKEGAEAGAALAMQTLTEAVEKCDVAYFKGVRSVLMIRCMAHREVAAFNATEAAGGECAVCAVEALREERDAAIRENVAADQRGWERAISAVRFALADYPHAGLDSEIGAQVERIVAKKTESAIRERDEAREQAQKHDPFMRLERAALSERADRVEALLRECQQYMGGLGLGRRGQALLAKIREALQ